MSLRLVVFTSNVVTLRHSKDNEMIPKIISFLLYLGAFLIVFNIQKIPEQTKMFIIISARKVRVAYR